MTTLGDEGQSSLLPVCVLAGGLGTRLGKVTRQIPKPLVEVAGEPFLVHQLRLLASYGARRVVLCVGHRGEMIEEAMGKAYAGIAIAYSYDSPGLDGTLGAIRRALPLLGERFLVLYGDTYLRLDYLAAQEAWKASGLAGLMAVLRNEGRWDVSNVVLRDGIVAKYDKQDPTQDMHWIDYGLGGFTADVIRESPEAERDLSGLQERLARMHMLCAYEAHERFYEIGTPIALKETEEFLAGLTVGTHSVHRPSPT